MKHKWLAILVLGIILASALPAPGVASAKASDFNATLTVTGIGDTTPTPLPAGRDGEDAIRWLVNGRSLTGTIAGDVNGTVVITNDGNLNVWQSGNMHGTFVITTAGGGAITGEDNVMLVAIRENPTVIGVIPQPDGSVHYQALARISATGRMIMKRGLRADTRFSGIITVVLDLDPATWNGHVIGVAPSPITLTGKQSS